MNICLIAALDQDCAIGIDNQLPWHLPDDLQFFKSKTQGSVVVMGRKTFESLGCRPLPNRRNVVLTRQSDWAHAGVETAQSWSDLCALLMLEGVEHLWVIGGGEVYRLTLPDADVLVITQVDTLLEQADTWFPTWSEQDWELVQSTHHPQDERHAFAFSWQVWARKVTAELKDEVS